MDTERTRVVLVPNASRLYYEEYFALPPVRGLLSIPSADGTVGDLFLSQISQGTWNDTVVDCGPDRGHTENPVSWIDRNRLAAFTSLLTSPLGAAFSGRDQSCASTGGRVLYSSSLGRA